MIGYATGGPSRQRAITETDALWLGRALMGEGGERDRVERLALAATMLRGWMISGTPTFAAWLRGFSQPINPRWLRGGDLATAHAAALARGERQGQEGATSAAAYARRERFQSMPWAAMPAALRADVLGVLNGTLSVKRIAPDACNFGGPSLYRTRYGLDTSSLGRRLATAPRAVATRESARGASAPEYVHVSPRPGANVFHSTAESRSANVRVIAGDNPRPASLPAPEPAPLGGSGVGVTVAVLVLALGFGLWRSGVLA